MNNSKRQQAAQETLKIIEAGEYLNQRGHVVSIRKATDAATRKSRLYRAEDFSDVFGLIVSTAKEIWEVTPETTLQAAQRVCAADKNADPFVLNFASARNPGGGFLGGAQAQEESLARSSSLYPCLTAHMAMYEFNRKNPSCFYSDWMIYSPQVPVFRSDDGALLDKPYLVSFLTAPAVNAGAVKQQEPEKVASIESVNRERARKLLYVANEREHQTLILGAWGCGVFQNDPAMIAQIFHELLSGEFKSCFSRVVMAVYDRTSEREVYGAFASVFGE